MKTTKRLLSAALILVMVLCLSASAFADGAQYETTQNFLAQIEQVDGVTYRVGSINSDSLESVYFSYEGKLSEYKSNFAMCFDEKGEEVEIYLFNLINFAEEDLQDVMDAVNDLNASSTGMKLYVDKSDNSVTAEMYLITTPASVTDIALTAFGFTIGFTDSALEMLKDYAV